VVWVAVDLSGQRLGPALLDAGFDRQAVTTWVWEGVVPYLTADEVSGTVAQVARLTTPGSQIVVNYQAKSMRTKVMRSLVRLVLRVSGQPDPLAGEPWRSLWRPDRLRRLLGRHGFDVLRDGDLLSLSEGLGLPSGDDGSLRNGRVAVAVRT
jgi:methyltransferase (TIGR00027 family)